MAKLIVEKLSDTEESKGYVGKYDSGKPLLISYKGFRIVQSSTNDVRHGRDPDLEGVGPASSRARMRSE